LRRNEDDPKEKPVSEKSASRRETIASPERDTLPSIDQQFLRDQLEALLSSHALRGGEAAPRDAQQAESDTNAYDRDTEPSADALLLRDAILAAGKSA
jgi:hypothetical protein